MNNRNLIAWTTAISAILCASFAAAQRTRLDDVMKEFRLSRSDAAACIVLGDGLHMRQGEIVSISKDIRRSIFDITPAIVIGNDIDRDPVRVWKERHNEKWDDYASDLKMDLRSFNRLSVRDGNFERLIWTNLVNRCYGSRLSLWDDLRDRRLSSRDALVAIVLGEGDPYTCDRIVTEYCNRGYNWTPVWAWFLVVDFDFGHHRFDRFHDRDHDRDDRFRERDRERDRDRDDHRWDPRRDSRNGLDRGAREGRTTHRDSEGRGRTERSSSHERGRGTREGRGERRSSGDRGESGRSGGGSGGGRR